MSLLDDAIDGVLWRLENWQHRRNERHKVKKEEIEEQEKEPVRMLRHEKRGLEIELENLADIDAMLEVFQKMHETDASDRAKYHTLQRLAAKTTEITRRGITAEAMDMQLRIMNAVIDIKHGGKEPHYTTAIIMKSLPDTPLYKTRLAELEEVEVIENELEVAA